VLRREGLGRVVARAAVVARGAVYRYVVFIAMDLTAPVPEVQPGPPVEMHLLRSDDLEAYARSRSRSVGSVPALRRLEEGDVCVAAWLDGEIVSTAWYAFESVRVDEIGRLIRLAPDEAYVYDSYTTESLRGLSIASLRGRWAFAHFRELGFRRTVGWVSPENLPAFGPARKLGYDTLGRAGYFCLGPWRREFVKPAGGKRRWASRGEPIVLARDFDLGSDD
jgi:GNAT superfamily N-acetyltransferase